MQVPQQSPLIGRQNAHPPVGGVGLGGVGVGGVGVGGPAVHPEAHQHTFPPFPQPLPTFTEEQVASASCPSAHMVDDKGSFLAQTYLLTDATGGGVGGSVGGLVGGGGVVGAFEGGAVGTGVGGGLVGRFVGEFVGTGVGGGGSILSVMVTTAVPGDVAILIVFTVIVTVFPVPPKL